jgi:hypothetical protein
VRILVTGASIVHALPVIRQLGRLGHELTVADSHPHASGFYSRYTRARWLYPPLAEGPQRFGEALCDFLKRHPHDRVVPLFEDTLPLAWAAERFPDQVKAPLGSYAQLMRFHDKAALYRFAAEVGVPVPPTVAWTGQSAGDLPFPAMLKVPQSSCGRGVLRVERAGELEAAWSFLARDHQLPARVQPLLQQAIDAEPLCVLGYAWEGRPKGLLVYRNLCMYPRRGGGGVIRESVRHPEVERLALALIRASKWHGPVGFDFLVERGTGRVFLIDANPRITPGVQLALRMGFDAAAMMASDQEPEDAGVVPAGHANVTEPMGFSWLLECLAAGPAGWRELWQMLGPLLRSSPDVLDRRDLRSLLAGPAALGDFLRGWRSQAPSGLEMIRHGQYADYDHRADADPARAGEG